MPSIHPVAFPDDDQVIALDQLMIIGGAA